MNKGERTNKRKAVMAQQVKEKENEPKFPAGIKVLVVDDDETCLIWVENLLLTCNFKVTTTLYAREAIEMLRRNKREFDLVITDVQMPEINGFQLLEIIGLEMDLPVIMMSVYNHQDYVKQGVLHGAVDYLVKPVRTEEIQNVWQHVLRKRKDLIREKRAAIQGKSIQGCADSAVADSAGGTGDTSSKRRRDQPKDDDDDYEEEDDSGNDNDEANPNKKPRVVWSPALHQKFVAAVNHLGIDKAVPKKILDIMDVDNITRENIASHLQKYRLYLKKAMEGDASQNTSKMLGYTGGRFPNSPFSPSLGKFFSGQFNFGGISSSDLIQSGQNLRNSLNPQVKLQPSNGLPSLPNTNLLQGMAGGFQQNPAQAGKTMAHLGHGATGFHILDNFVDPKMVMTGSNNNNSLVISGPSQFSQTTLSPVTGALKIGGMASSSNAGFVDHIGNHDNWKPIVQNPQSSLQMPEAFTPNQHSMSGISAFNNQPQLLGFPQLSSICGETSILGHSGSFSMTQTWDINNKTDYSQELNNVFEALNPITGANGGSNIMGSLPIQSRLAGDGDSFTGHIQGTPSQTIGQELQTGILEQVTPQDDFIPNNMESMDDIMNAINSRDNNNGGGSSMFMDGEFDFDAYNQGSGL